MKDSLKIELVGGTKEVFEGNVVGHKFDQKNPGVIVGYCNNDNSSMTIVVPLSQLSKMTIIEGKDKK